MIDAPNAKAVLREFLDHAVDNDLIKEAVAKVCPLIESNLSL